MKFLTLLLSVCCVSLIYSQATYYQMDNGVVVDSSEYFSFKAEATKQLSSNPKEKFRVKEKLKELRRNQDSIIYSVSLEFEFGEIQQHVQKKSILENYIGKELPFASFTTLTGDSIQISDLIGKPTMLTFWHTKCPPCIEEMPVLNKIHEQFKGKVNFIAVTFETRDKTMEFLKTHPFSYTQIPNAKKFIQDIELVSYPTNLFLDKEAKLKEIQGPVPFVMDENYKMSIGDGKEFIAILKGLL